MSIYLIGAYAIFCITPVALAVSIEVQRRKVERQIAAIRGE